MLDKQRQMKIMAEIKRDGFVLIKDLMVSLDASRSSIMRDLNFLEKQGLLIRQRGGASLKPIETSLNAFTDLYTLDKENIQKTQKQIVCKEASKLLHDGQCVYVDSGSTATYLSPYLTDLNITLVTPSVFLLRRLQETFKGNVFLLGGTYYPKYNSSLGTFTNQQVQQFNFDVALFTCSGLNIEKKEITVVDYELGALKSEVLKRSKKNILLIDSSKLHMSAPCRFASIEDMDVIFIDDLEKMKNKPKNFVVCKETSYETVK